MRARLIAAACAAASGLLLAPVADAATWRGKTDQGRSVSVRTGADGLVTKALIRYEAGCSDGKGFRSRVEFLPPLDSSAPDAFRDAGVVRWRIESAGERARGRASITGRLRSSGRWTGSFRLRVRITKAGRHVATCRSGRVGWTASPV